MGNIQIRKPPALNAIGSTKVVLVGGFLGSGKTTALHSLAKSLSAKGKHVGLIANDQAPGLVDTARLSDLDSPVAEVAGGCFCCQFDLFASQFGELAKSAPDVILCEPVGSCTDMVATVIRPLRYYYGKQLQIAPFVVLVDPMRLKAFLAGSSPFPADVTYIYDKQLLEADEIAITKADLIDDVLLEDLVSQVKSRYDKAAYGISAVDGRGIGEWCRSILGEDQAGDRVLAEIDYDQYANGEAELGWLNATFAISGRVDGAMLAATILNGFRTKCSELTAEIAHVKVEIASGGRSVFGNLTSTIGEPAIDGREVLENPVLILNARVRIDPEKLGAMAMNCLIESAALLGVKADVQLIQSFKPGYPRPPYRMDGEAK